MERQRAPPKGREAENGSRGIDSRGRIPERLRRCNGRYAKEQRRQREQEKKARRWYFIKQKAYGLVEVKAGQGASAGWGRLKSGAGWISLDYATRLA